MGRKIKCKVAQGCIDLPAEAVYHIHCMTEFRLKNADPNCSKGRPAEKEMVPQNKSVCNKKGETGVGGH